MRRGGRGRIERQALAPPPGVTREDCSGRRRLEIDPDTLDHDALASVAGRVVDPAMRHATAVVLWPDGESGYDSLAVAVWADGIRVGWLTHADSAAVNSVVRALADADVVLECGAVVEGVVAPSGGRRVGGWVAFDPERARAALEAPSAATRSMRPGRFVSPA